MNIDQVVRHHEKLLELSRAYNASSGSPIKRNDLRTQMYKERAKMCDAIQFVRQMGFDANHAQAKLLENLPVLTVYVKEAAQAVH